MASAFDTSKCTVEDVERLTDFTMVQNCAVRQAPPAILDCLDIDTPLSLPPLPGPPGDNGGITIIPFYLTAPLAQGGCGTANYRIWDPINSIWDTVTGDEVENGVCDVDRIGPGNTGDWGQFYYNETSGRNEIVDLERSAAQTETSLLEIRSEEAISSNSEDPEPEPEPEPGKPLWADGDKLWVGRLLTLSIDTLEYDLGIQIWVWVLDEDLSEEAPVVPLLAEERYIGKYIGSYRNEDDIELPLYAIRRNDKLFRFRLEADLPAGGITIGKMLWWNDGDWDQIGETQDLVAGYDTLYGSTGDHCLARYEPVRGIWMVEQISC